MSDLYDALGVAKDADEAAIRGAYRRAAKKAHPDAGGSPERWALVKLAHDTLTDDASRDRYDRTGETGGRTPDQDEANSRQMAFAALEAVLNEIERRRLSYSDIDVIADAVRTLRNNQERLYGEITAFEAAVAKAQKAAKRLKAKKGKQNLLADMMQAKVEALQRSLAAKKRERPPLVRAIEILAEHTWDKTPEPRPAEYNSAKDPYLLQRAMKPGPMDFTPFGS